MSALGGVLVGVAAMWLLGIIVGCLLEREMRAAVARMLLAPVLVPLIALGRLAERIELAGHLPKLTRRKVTADSLREALDHDEYGQRTWAINSRRYALVLLARPAPPVHDTEEKTRG